MHRPKDGLERHLASERGIGTSVLARTRVRPQFPRSPASEHTHIYEGGEIYTNTKRRKHTHSGQREHRTRSQYVTATRGPVHMLILNWCAERHPRSNFRGVEFTNFGVTPIYPILRAISTDVPLRCSIVPPTVSAEPGATSSWTGSSQVEFYSSTPFARPKAPPAPR